MVGKEGAMEIRGIASSSRAPTRGIHRRGVVAGSPQPPSRTGKKIALALSAGPARRAWRAKGGGLRPGRVRLRQGPGLVQEPKLAPVQTSGLNCPAGARSPSLKGCGERGRMARSLINVLWAARWVEIARRSC